MCSSDLNGHTHVPAFFHLTANGAKASRIAAGKAYRLEERTLVNAGSVGQPRDGDPRAAWLLLDLERRFAAFHRVPYSIEETQSEMHERGLPDLLAARLERGE